MKNMMAAAVFGLASMAALAHNIDADITKFEKIHATKDPNSKEAREAKVYFHSDTVQLLRIRALLNDGFKFVGAQPAFLGSEIKRLEDAIASPKTSDPAMTDAARKLLLQAKAEKAAYDVLHDSVGEKIDQAMKLIEAAK